MDNDAPAPATSGAQLTELILKVRAARRDVQALRAGKVDPALLLAARGVLLDAMENYATELARRGLPMPPALRDDLRLHRAIRDREQRPRSPYSR